MLGRKVDAAIYGMVTNRNVYTGYIRGGVCNNETVYIVSRRSLKDTVQGIVIAVATDEKSKKNKLIISPENESTYYAPELNELLSGIRGFNYTKLQCLHEKSCGALIFKRADDDFKVLLVKNHNGRYWSFPKGHIEKGETEHQTAIREIREETGLSVRFINGFREISDYSPYGKIKKRVVFFLGEASRGDVHIQTSEIDYFIWVTFAQARNMCSYANDLRVINKAEKLVREIYK